MAPDPKESSALQSLETFRPERYEGLDLDRLAAFAVWELGRRGVRSTFENTVVALHKLFPLKFSLVGFVQYPDSARVNRALLHCQPKYKNYLVGNGSSGYQLTNGGLGAAGDAGRLLQEGPPPEKKNRQRSVQPRSIADKFMREVRASRAFGMFSTGGRGEVGFDDVLPILHSGSGTRRVVLRQRMDDLVEYAKLAGDSEVEALLHWLREAFANEL